MEYNKNISFWEWEAYLTGINHTIIGAGIVGLNAAIELKTRRPNQRIIVIDRGILPAGASTRNAGFATFGSISELEDDLQHQSMTQIMDTISMRWEGFHMLQQQLRNYPFEYNPTGGAEIFLKDQDENHHRDCISQIDKWNEAIFKVTSKPHFFSIGNNTHTHNFKRILGIIIHNYEGQIHPGLMMFHLKNKAKKLGVEFLSGVEIKGIDESISSHLKIKTIHNWHITSEKVIIATNGFAHKLMPNLDVKPARNQVLLTKPIPKLKFQGCFHLNRGYFYFRNVGKRILIGGGRHLDSINETTDIQGTSPIIQSALLGLLNTVILPLEDFEIESSWSGILGVGSKKQPIVQKINERISIAVRLGGMGIAIGSLVGHNVAKLHLTR